jgi:flavin reductase (DIM6/NTAB) family NADH-FMN oxidoreductase RutF
MIDPDTFRAVLGRFATGITVVTARDANGRDHGMTVSAFASVSLEPPMVLVCVAHDARMHQLLLDTDTIGISFLSGDQEALSRRFADPECERFDGVGYARGESGVVLLDEALAHLECTIVARHGAGDHTIHVAQVDRAEPFTTPPRPLLYYRGGYAQLER